MVFFLVTRAGRHVLDKYLASWGGDFLDDVCVVPYPTISDPDRLIPGTYIFADLERLSARERNAAARVWESLHARGDGFRLLNHPTRSLSRFDLLEVLHAEGLNRFAAYRADGWDGTAQFPVFLRCESDHTGPRTELLWDADEVELSLRRQVPNRSDRADWLIVEFEDSADDAGYFRKYSSFMLDGELMPRHVFFSRHWVQKHADLRGGSWAQEEQVYLEADPDAVAIRRVFERAGIQYGRIDYSVGKDGIQVWEINTNPIILDPFDREDTGRIEVHEAFAEAWDPALRALIAKTPTGALPPWSARRALGRAHVVAEALKETRPGRLLRRLKHRLSDAPTS